MKKFFTITCTVLFLSANIANAKQFYEFSYENGVTYKNLTNPTIISEGNWTTLNIERQLPFDFRVFDEPVDRFTITDEEGITFYGEYKWASVFPFKAEFHSRGGATSPVSYKVEGTAPNRIMKVEFRNMGFKNEIEQNETSLEYTSFQVWLYETSYDVEFHYGIQGEGFGKIPLAGKDGPVVGILGHNLFEEVGFYLIGNSDMPEITLTDTEKNLATWPIENWVYKMKPSFNTNSIETKDAVEVSIYPNPFGDELNIELEDIEANVTIVDVAGRVIYKQELTQGQTSIETKDFVSGVYFVSITSSKGVITRKLIKS